MRFDIENPHSGLGVVKEFDKEDWLLKYKDLSAHACMLVQEDSLTSGRLFLRD